MKWTVLSDNRVGLQIEHGLSLLLQTERYRLLLDTGACDLFIRNAEHMGIDLRSVDYVFISHGHSDHAGGLRYFLEINNRAKIILSPHALNGKFFSKHKCLHSITAHWPKDVQDRLLLVDHTTEIAPGLHIIANIPKLHPLPQGNQHLFVRDADGNLVADDFHHELALHIEGLLFTGCAHSGLENILEACPWPVHTVVGGFHLLDNHETEAELTALGTRLKEAYPQTHFYTSHCTGDAAFQCLKTVLGERLHAFMASAQMVSVP